MPALNWNEIKRRAIGFANNWKAFRVSSFAQQGRARERAEAQTFWNEFFAVFGIERRVVASFEEPVKNLAGDTNFIDLFYKGRLIAEHKSPGRPLDKAHAQAMGYIQSLHREGRGDEAPPFVVVSDFQRIALYDLDADKSVTFELKDLPKHVRRFGFLIDASAAVIEDEDDADLKATRIMSALHDALETGGFRGHDLERMLVRILFCLFADDTAIFHDDPAIRPFERYVRRTRLDGSDLGPALARLFSVLDHAPKDRQANLDEDLAAFPHVNGALFAERLDFADFNFQMREQLIACCKFNWSRISPAVFGSLFQGVMDDRERRQLGAHYTSERDILKLVRSLFLDDLRGELGAIQDLRSGRDRNTRLAAFQDKLRGLNFLDPACGCGNFLVIAYRELRRLELDVLKMLHTDQRVMNLRDVVKVNVDQFYGIEIEEWPARIAEVAMWLMDHQMNGEAADAFALPLVRLPLTASATIRNGNALRTDWNDVLPAGRCAYVLGNPPFVGKSLMSAAQAADAELIAGSVQGNGVLDFVTMWYFKAADYTAASPAIRVAFVSTNSVAQGEQVGFLWSELFRRGMNIHFAYRTFVWESEARGKAHVHVVIIGFGRTDPIRRFIVEVDDDGGEIRENVAFVGPYLTNGKSMPVLPRTTPLSDVPPMVYGSKPVDGQHLILEEAERAELIEEDQRAANVIRPFLGSVEFINGLKRDCIWLQDVPPSEWRDIAPIRRRIEAVREFRGKSVKAATREKADTPALFAEIRQPLANYLLVPSVSSETRRYIPIGFIDAQTIVSNLAFAVPGATLYHFGVLSSAMHMAWVRTVCGRLKSDYRYSNKLVYNNYPWPTAAGAEAKAKVERAAQGVVDARASFAGQTLADLYDPDAMPPALTKAHAALDAAVDRCYRRDPFKADRDRVEYLFALYETLATPLTPVVASRSKRR